MTMWNILTKSPSRRTARAQATVRMAAETIDRIRRGDVPKGDPLPVAKVAAIQAVKNTSAIIPYCHPIPIEQVTVDFEIGQEEIIATVGVGNIARTGVEVEAMTGASVAALTLYDMLKMLDDTLSIGEVVLLEKTGGKSEKWRRRKPHGLRAAVLVLSDSIAAGRKEDLSGKMIAARLEREGVEVADYRIIPDEVEQIEQTLLEYADRDRLNLVVTTGGTGFAPRDRTPEAMERVIEKEAPGIAEAARAYGQERTPLSMLSRARAGIRGCTLIVNLPGSRSGVADSLDALFPAILHAFKMLRGEGHDDDPRPEVRR